MVKRKARSGKSDGPPAKCTKNDPRPQSNLSSHPQAEHPKLKTIRISRIPKRVSRDKLVEWLGELPLPGGPAIPPNLIQCSIAPYSSELMQATATFQVLPVLLDNVDKGTQTINGPDQSRLFIDVHFDGMTILYDSMWTHAKLAEVE